MEYNLNIGFISVNKELTLTNFKNFVKHNKFQIKDFDYDLGECTFEDNTHVKCLYKATKYSQIDQIIISGSKTEIDYLKENFNFYYDCLFTDMIPIDFVFIEDLTRFNRMIYIGR